MLKLINKKGTMQMWWIIGAAILAFLAILFLILWFKGTGDSSFDHIDDVLGGLSDCDDDLVADLSDKCVCDSSIGEEFPEGKSSDDCKIDSAATTKCPTKCKQP